MSNVKLKIAIDRSRCVLCGGPNECALARGKDEGDAPCWCVAESFPAELLTTATVKDGGASCVCRKCLEAGQHAERTGSTQ